MWLPFCGCRVQHETHNSGPLEVTCVTFTCAVFLLKLSPEVPCRFFCWNFLSTDGSIDNPTYRASLKSSRLLAWPIRSDAARHPHMRRNPAGPVPTGPFCCWPYCR